MTDQQTISVQQNTRQLSIWQLAVTIVLSTAASIGAAAWTISASQAYTTYSLHNHEQRLAAIEAQGKDADTRLATIEQRQADAHMRDDDRDARLKRIEDKVDALSNFLLTFDRRQR